MEALLGPAIGLVGNIFGGIFNNQQASQRQDEAQRFAVQQAATAEQYFRTNRQTAYQDTMADMAAAGLNPILAYQRGATPGTMGPIAAPVNAPVQDVGIGAGINSALAARRQNFELENMRQQNELLKAQTAKTAAEKETELNRPENVKQDTEKLRATTGYTYQQMMAGLKDAMESQNISNWISANPELAKAMIVAAWGGGKAGELLAPFRDAVSAMYAGKNNSARTPTPSPQNFDNRFGTPVDQYRAPRSQNFEPAPGRPRGGWFDQRFYGVDR